MMFCYLNYCCLSCFYIWLDVCSYIDVIVVRLSNWFLFLISINVIELCIEKIVFLYFNNLSFCCLK